ncbi:hypothetical protein KQX54_016063 [Cotesia glomerata]|uniref:Uncharacterized protein n=1 Tax=Cotesia glomerata TaxID=32391 RepID=A0AAV7I6F3_COTGL|nr:hypothetical protein KQX54_016063 [Cotesia glomerata]
MNKDGFYRKKSGSERVCWAFKKSGFFFATKNTEKKLDRARRGGCFWGVEDEGKLRRTLMDSGRFGVEDIQDFVN